MLGRVAGVRDTEVNKSDVAHDIIDFIFQKWEMEIKSKPNYLSLNLNY